MFLGFQNSGMPPSKRVAFSKSGPLAPMVKTMLLLRIDKSRISGLKFKNDIVSSVRRISPVSDTDTQQQARPLQGRNTPSGAS